LESEKRFGNTDILREFKENILSKIYFKKYFIFYILIKIENSYKANDIYFRKSP